MQRYEGLLRQIQHPLSHGRSDRVSGGGILQEAEGPSQLPPQTVGFIDEVFLLQTFMLISLFAS